MPGLPGKTSTWPVWTIALSSLKARRYGPWKNFGDVAPFDMIFIDADKPNNPGYLEWALHYSRPGTLIVGDNVVRDGEVINRQSDDARVQGVRRFIEMMGDNPRLSATALQTVGVKGWDGFTLALVNG